MSVSDAEPFIVGEWLVQPDLLQISRNGDVRKLEYKTMEILLFLVSNEGEVVSKQRLHDEIWKEVYVTDNALTRTVSKLRKALDDDPLDAQYIDTISKSGYRLVATVVRNTQLSETDSRSTNVGHGVWLWGVVAVMGIGWFSLKSVASVDAFAQFYDPLPISTRVGPERAHSISPDGQKVSFSYSEPSENNSDVYVKMLDDLSEVKFTDLDSHQGYGIWSPDGNYMAYAGVEDGTCGIYKESIFGGEKIRIGDCYGMPDDFVWSPDGGTIAFTDFKTVPQERTIFFLNVESHVAEAFMIPDSGTTHRDPAFTSDGKHIVYRRSISGQGADIFKISLVDKTSVQLTFDNARIFGLDVFDDDKQIAFSSNRGGQWALWRMPIDGGPITRFYINDRILLEPRFARNTNRLVYKSVTDQTQLWSFRWEGDSLLSSQPVAPSTRTDMHPAVSSDGTKLAFVSDRSGAFEIWSTDLTDGTPTKLTRIEGSFVNSPSWSPDGKEIVFDARLDGNSSIYVLDVASKMKRKFIDLPGDQVNASYSQDGKYIYFASNHKGGWNVMRTSALGNGRAEIVAGGGLYLREGFDGFLYFMRTDMDGIWRIREGEKAHLLISDAGAMDWGSWAPSEKGILYLDRSSGPRLLLRMYGGETSLVYDFSKRVQYSTPTISASQDGRTVVIAQIERSEDELMLVDFD